MIVGDAVKSATLLIGSLDSRNIPMQIMHSPVIRSSCCFFFATFSTSSFCHSSCEPRRSRVVFLLKLKISLFTASHHQQHTKWPADYWTFFNTFFAAAFRCSNKHENDQNISYSLLQVGQERHVGWEQEIMEFLNLLHWNSINVWTPRIDLLLICDKRAAISTTIEKLMKIVNPDFDLPYCCVTRDCNSIKIQLCRLFISSHEEFIDYSRVCVYAKWRHHLIS